jgi:sugar/nucleoside kinase (ribokinase family)
MQGAANRVEVAGRQADKCARALHVPNPTSEQPAVGPATHALPSRSPAQPARAATRHAARRCAAQAARSAGVPVFLDAGGVEAPLSRELLSQVTLLSPNETELARLARRPTGSLGEVEAAGRALLGRGVPQVLVKLGGEGSMLLQGAGCGGGGWGRAWFVGRSCERICKVHGLYGGSGGREDLHFYIRRAVMFG